MAVSIFDFFGGTGGMGKGSTARLPVPARAISPARWRIASRSSVGAVGSYFVPGSRARFTGESIDGPDGRKGAGCNAGSSLGSGARSMRVGASRCGVGCGTGMGVDGTASGASRAVVASTGSAGTSSGGRSARGGAGKGGGTREGRGGSSRGGGGTRPGQG